MPLGMYALRMVDDVDVAEDLVQEAFVKTWEALRGGAEIDNFKAWMYRCVRNECAAFLRRKCASVEIDSLPEVEAETIDTSERDAEIWRAIDALPRQCRLVFLMSKRDGMSGQEIADELGISIKTVKNQMTKALARLRSELASGHKPFFLPFL